MGRAAREGVTATLVCCTLLLLLICAGPVDCQRRDLQRVIQQLRSSPRYRPTHRPAAHQLIGTGGLRLQSERGGGGGSGSHSRRRADTGQLHWQQVPPRHRQHRASVRGLPNLIASLLPPKKSLFRSDKKKKKRAKSTKRVDKSKFNPPKDIRHGFEPYFRGSPAFDASSLEQPEIVSDRSLMVSASTTLPATASRLPKSPPPKTSSRPIIRRQNVAKTQSPSQSVSTPKNEEIFRENSNIDHFFEGVDENFPELDSYGVGWESRKLASWKAALMAEQEQEQEQTGAEQEQTRAGNRRRRKREAYEPAYYSADRTRLSGRPQLWRGGIRERQYGEVGAKPAWERQSLEWGLRERQDQGFWEEEEFDSDFFHGGRGGGLSPQMTYAQAYQLAQEARSKRRPSYRPAPARERYDVEDNEILGSGNFDIVKGGTFYQNNDFQYRFNSNKPTAAYDYYGNQDYFQNFRDFADIKGKAKVGRY